MSGRFTPGGRHWRARSLRTRLVVGSVVPLAVGLAVGTIALAALFAAGRVGEVDRQTLREVDVLAGLVATAQLPQPLPVPAGSTLLAQVVDDGGTVIAAGGSASRLLPLVAAAPGPRDAVRTDEQPAFGDTPLRLRSRTGRLEGRAVTLVVAAPLGDVRRAVQALRLVLLLVVPLLVLLATVLARYLVASALRPVEELRAAAVGLSLSPGPGARLPVGDRDDELGRLAQTLDALLRRMQDAVAQQRAFVADAAHELRSPLASMRVQLDVAAAHPGLGDAGRLAADLRTDLDRLQALVDDLLLLARLDARAPLARRPVDLAELAGTTTGPVVVLGDRAALERLLRNLLDNARRAAGTVQVSAGLVDGRAVLDVDDDGPGIAPADRSRVFERWVRLDDARSRGAGGSGLGLALVREVASAHGGEVCVLDSPLGGARLRVVLPAAPG